MFIFIMLLSLISVGIISATYFFLVLGLTIVAYILYAIGCYKVFQKANVPGIYAWIPIVNEYFAYKIAWGTPAFIVALVADVVAHFNQDGGKVSFGWIFSIISVVVNFMFTQKLSKAFGKSEFFGLGLFFFQPIFLMILGFGDAQYLGNQN